MDKWQKVVGSTLAAVAIATAGCSGSSPFKNLLAKRDKPAPRDPGVVNAGKGIGHKGPAEKKGFTDNVASTWKSMTGKVSDALSIKPKETKPTDPVSLDSDPGPIDPNLFVTTAELLERGGKFEEAEKQYAKALKADPKYRAALIGIARLHDRQGRFPLAEKGYIRAIKAHPRQADFYNDLGLCLARQRKTELAVGILNKAVKLDPSKVLYRNNLATVLVDQGKYDEALKHFAVAQDEAVAHYNLGYLLSKRNQNEAAIRHLRIASQMKPEFAQAQQMLAQLAANQPASNASPNFRITDREAFAAYTKPEVPAQFTSGVMLSRLPAIDESEPTAETVDEREEPEQAKRPATTDEQPQQTTSDEKEPQAGESSNAESEKAADDEQQPETQSTEAPTDSRDSAFIPAQPEQMTPPEPTP